MDKENEEGQNINNISQKLTIDKNENFAIETNAYQKWLVNIDDILILENNKSEGLEINTSIIDIYSDTTNNITSNLWKFKVIWIWVWVLFLFIITGVLVYMMYPVEFQNISKNIKADVTVSQTWISTNTWSITSNNQDIPISNIDNSWKQAIDNLFVWSWNNTSDNADKQTDNNTDANWTTKIWVDDTNKLMQNPDWSSWLTNDSTLLEWLWSGNNYWNWDEQSKITSLSQIRAKIQIAKINYKQAKDSWNIQAMKLLANANIKYNNLLSKVENNEMVVTNEIQDALVEIQSIVDQSKNLMK